MRAAKIIGKIAYVLLCIVTALVILVSAAALVFCIGEGVVERTARVLPSYPREEIAGLAARTEWTEEEYALLSRQTGLGRSALEEYRGDAQSLLQFQDALFYDGEAEHEIMEIIVGRDTLGGYSAPIVRLQAGDVLITSATHSFGWRHGHAALIVSDFGATVEAMVVGVPSERKSNGYVWFTECSNFMVLRLKDSAREARAAVADWANEHLVNVVYDLTTGVLSKKDQKENVTKTQCAHLVWQAFKQFGYEIDSDGGPVCTPRDIANCGLFEVRQMYGFDPAKGW